MAMHAQIYASVDPVGIKSKTKPKTRVRDEPLIAALVHAS